MTRTPPSPEKKASNNKENNNSDIVKIVSTMSSFAIVGLFVLAVFYTLFLTADFMIPVFAAVLLNLILSPIIRVFKDFGINTSFASAIVVFGLMSIVIGGFYSLSDPVSNWISRIPEISEQIEEKISIIKEPMQNVQKASEEVEKITDVKGSNGNSQEVVVKETSLLDRIFGSLRYIAIQLALVFILLYFLLSVGDLFKRKLIKVMPNLTDKLKAERVTTQIEIAISHYLLTITLINIGLGVVIALALYLIGLPNPLLWGIMATLLNFIPYIGAVVGTIIIGIVSMIAFDSISYALLAPAIYAGVDILEAQIITPSILSQRLTLNPVVVFLTVAFWGWFWGISGALMAVPILVIIKIICDHVEGFNAIGEFLSGDRKNAFVIASEKWEENK